jgi:hypothetical protein
MFANEAQPEVQPPTPPPPAAAAPVAATTPKGPLTYTLYVIVDKSSGKSVGAFRAFGQADAVIYWGQIKELISGALGIDLGEHLGVAQATGGDFKTWAKTAFGLSTPRALRADGGANRGTFIA